MAPPALRSFTSDARASLSNRALHQQDNWHKRQHDHGKHPEAVEIGKGRRLLLTQIVECLQGQLLRGDRIARLLKEHRTCSVGERLHRRIEGVEILTKPKVVELLTVLMQGLAQRCPD